MRAAVEAEEDAKVQRQLAAALVCLLGYEEAIRACQAMSWHGALLHLLGETVPYTKGAAPALAQAPAAEQAECAASSGAGR